MTVLLDNKTQPWPHEPKREVGRADRDTIDLLREILQYLQHIQMSHKGSIGSLNNTYLPQLRVDILDGLTARITERLSQLGISDEQENQAAKATQEAIAITAGQAQGAILT